MAVRSGRFALTAGIGLAFLIWVLLPMGWIVNTSLKRPGTEYLIDQGFWPNPVSWQAYEVVLVNREFWRPLGNSLFVSLGTAGLTLLLGSLAAFALVQLRFRYRVQTLLWLQFGAMTPPVVTLAPTFLLLRDLDLLASLPGLIIPNTFYNVPLTTWLLTAYFAGLPAELDDAARIDGCNTWQRYAYVLLPLARPALFAAGMFAFIGSYGEFMLASVVSLGQTEVQTAPVAIQNFAFAFRRQWTWVSAGIILTVLPVIGLALSFQGWVVRGLSLGAVR